MTPLWLLCLFAAVAAAVFADDVPQLKRGTETSGRASRQVPFSSSLSGAPPTSNVSNGNIFHNAGAHIGADPYALWDAKSGFYYVYSTAEPDPGYYFALYRSPDLSTWQRLPGGAMKGCSGYNTSSQAGNACWSSDARWAPEVYHNEETGWYFLFFTARLRKEHRKDYFRYSAFTDAWKLGVGVSRSPEGPFEEIKHRPIDYYPFDPDYVDINLIMDIHQRDPPKRRITHGLPRGIYAPSIDANLYFGADGRIFLYFARNYYRNWRWDEKLGKYLQESEIWGVELNTTWWHDTNGQTMPSIIHTQKDRFKGRGDPLPQNITRYNGTNMIGYPPRKDGFERIVGYRLQPQSWENNEVNEYNKTTGQDTDRRETEGSTMISRKTSSGQTKYVIFYSANNLETEAYGVGYATADKPLGPFVKSPDNPVLHYVNGSSSLPGIFGPGHGSVVASRANDWAKGKDMQKRVVNAAPNTDKDLDRGTSNSNTVQRAHSAGDNSDMTMQASDQNGMRATPNGAELFYIHHAHLERNNAGNERRLYTTRLRIDADGLGKNDSTAHVAMKLTGMDQAMPKGTTPIQMEVTLNSIACSQPHAGVGAVHNAPASMQRAMHAPVSNVVVEVALRSAGGAAFDIGEISNRLVFTKGDASGGGSANSTTVVEPVFTETTSRGSLVLFRAPPMQRGERFTLTYQRSSVDKVWHTVDSKAAQCP